MGYVLIALGLIVAAVGVVMVVKSGKAEPTVHAIAPAKKTERSSAAGQSWKSGSDNATESSVNSSSESSDSSQLTAKEKGNAFEAYVADRLKRFGFKIKQWNQGTVTSAGAMGENALNPDFFVEQPYGNNSIEYWLECKWRKDITGAFTFHDSQINRYRKIQRESKRKVFIFFGVGGQPSDPGSVYIVPLDSINGSSITRDEMKPFYYSHLASQLVPRMSRYFKEEVFKRK